MHPADADRKYPGAHMFDFFEELTQMLIKDWLDRVRNHGNNWPDLDELDNAVNDIKKVGGCKYLKHGGTYHDLIKFVDYRRKDSYPPEWKKQSVSEISAEKLSRLQDVCWMVVLSADGV